jgi:hypothetical protein
MNKIFRLTGVIGAAMCFIVASGSAQATSPGKADQASPSSQGQSEDTAKSQDQDYSAMTVDQLRDGIENRHPAAYLILAQKLFTGGKRDEAIFWLYEGQLRFRIYLACHPDLPSDGEPALFSSMNHVIAKPLNQYAFGDIDTLVATIDRALDWDSKTENGFIDKDRCADAIRDQHRSLNKFNNRLIAKAKEIRAERAKAGLQNR